MLHSHCAHRVAVPQVVKAPAENTYVAMRTPRRTDRE